MRRLSDHDIFIVFMVFGLIFAVTTVAWSSTISISGSYVDSDARTWYTVGTEHDDNPAIGLDFYAEGPITYTYSIPYNINVDSYPILPGTSKTFNVQPSLQLSGTPSLTTVQQVNSGTDLFFGIDTWLTGDWDVDISLPNFYESGVSVTLNSTGTLSSTGTNFESYSSSWGPGTGIISGGSDIMFDESGMDAWSADVDLFDIIDVLEPLDSMGFDLDLGLGLDIVQASNILALYDYSFDLAPLELNIPADAIPGSIYQTSVSGTLNYDLVFRSDYDYSGNAHLDFDAPLFDSVNLLSFELGQFDVGSVTNQYSGILPVTVDVQYIVKGPNECHYVGLGKLFCRGIGWEPYLFDLYPPSSDSFFLPSNTTYTTPRIDYNPVPEPSTLLLISVGMAGVGLLRKRFKN